MGGRWDDDRMDRFASLVERIADIQLQQAQSQTQWVQSVLELNRGMVRLEATTYLLEQVIAELRGVQARQDQLIALLLNQTIEVVEVDPSDNR